MAAQSRHFLVTVETDYGADANERAALARSLRAELLKTDVDDVSRAPAGTLPGGAKSAEAADLATLLISVGDYAGLLAALVGAMTAWMQRNRGTELSLELPGKGRLALKSSEMDKATFDRFVVALKTALEEDDSPPA